MRSILSIATVSIVLLFTAAPELAAAQDRVARRVGNDVFRAGREVRFKESTAGDALLAGRRVTANGRIGGDAVVAGGRVLVQGPIDQDLYAAGGNVQISSTIKGSARVAGGQVEITPDADIADGATLAGGEVTVEGRIAPYLQIGGGAVRIEGRVDGDVEIGARELDIGPGAVIAGTVTFRGPEPARVAPGARIQGGVKYIRSEAEETARRGLFAFIGIATLIWMLGWLIVGILLLALLPHATRFVTQTLRARSWQSGLLGFALLIVVPVAIVVLGITLIGIPLALLLLVAYMVLLPLGYLAGIATLSDAVLVRLRRNRPVTTAARIGAFVLGVLFIYLLMLIPGIGALLSVLLLLFGMGGIVLAAFLRRRAQATAAA